MGWSEGKTGKPWQSLGDGYIFVSCQIFVTWCMLLWCIDGSSSPMCILGQESSGTKPSPLESSSSLLARTPPRSQLKPPTRILVPSPKVTNTYVPPPNPVNTIWLSVCCMNQGPSQRSIKPTIYIGLDVLVSTPCKSTWITLPLPIQTSRRAVNEPCRMQQCHTVWISY